MVLSRKGQISFHTSHNFRFHAAAFLGRQYICFKILFALNYLYISLRMSYILLYAKRRDLGINNETTFRKNWRANYN